MKNLSFSVLFLLICCAACHDDDVPETESVLPECIEDLLQTEQKPPIAQVSVQAVDGTLHYWLGTGAIAYDGDEYIVNSQCDTVCVYRGWFPDPCIEQYNHEDWEIIWEQ